MYTVKLKGNQMLKRKLHAYQQIRVVHELKLPDAVQNAYYGHARQSCHGTNAVGMTVTWAPFTEIDHPCYVRHSSGTNAVYAKKELEALTR